MSCNPMRGIRMGILAAGLLAAGRAHALDIWGTVDSITGGTDGSAQDIAIDGTGRIFAVGYTTDANFNSTWTVRLSFNNGASWHTALTYQLPGGVDSSAEGVAIDSVGRVYVAGSAADANGVYHWIVFESTDGLSWTRVFDFNAFAGHDSLPGTVAVDGSDNIYVAGEAYDTNDIGGWLTMVSPDRGVTWSRSDNYHLTPGQESAPTQLCRVGGAIVAVGYGIDANVASHWIVRRTTGAGWSTVDDYAPAIETFAGGCGVNQALNLMYAGGSYFNTSHWVVRKSTDQGQSWATADDLALQYLTAAGGAAADAGGGTT